MLGFAILIAFHMLGMLLQYGLHVPLPANVIGLSLFTLSLFLKVVKLEWVEETAVFLNRHMLLFFCPIIVGTIAFIPYIRAHAALILITFFGSWLAVLLASGWTTRLFHRGGADQGDGTLSQDKGSPMELRPSLPKGGR